jgi:hypothetical protein
MAGVVGAATVSTCIIKDELELNVPSIWKEGDA